MMTQKIFFFAKCCSKVVSQQRTYVHERIAVDHCLPHLNDVDVVVAQRQSVPNHVALLCGARLAVAVLVHYILNGVHFCPAVIGIHYDVSALASFWRPYYRNFGDGPRF